MLVLAFLAWTLFSAARGALAGHSLKFLFLELAALGATALAWVVGGLRMTPADLRPVRTILILGGLGHVALGGWSYAVNHIRAGGIWYMPLPGMFAVMALVFALHTTSRRTRLLWTVLLGLFLWHQTISFTRGYWLGLLGALPWTAAMYAGIGPGSGARWRRVVAVTATGFALLAVATIATALFNGWSDLGALIGTRFNSSFATKGESASASNMARILEIVTSLRLISHQPVLGYGLGLEIRSRQPLFHAITRQWFIHQTYVWLWLKEGLVGLALLLALLWHAVRRGVRGARTLEPEAAAWCLTAAGATIYLAIVNLTNYHIAIVNAPTLQALLWGISVALTNPPRWRLVWRKEAAAAPVAVARV